MIIGWAAREGKAPGLHLDSVRGRVDKFEIWSELLNARARLGADTTDMTSYGQAACCHSPMQHLSA